MAPRAYWKGYLKLSLVSCPIALFPATSEREKISFHQINKNTGHRIKYRKVDADTGEEVEAANIIKGYQVGKDQYIELDPEEIEAVAIESKRTIEIDQFVPRDEIDEIYFGDPYYIVPDGEVGAQAFAVIREAIKKEGMVAIGKVVFTSREHVIALEARGKGLMGVPPRRPPQRGSRRALAWRDRRLHEPATLQPLANGMIVTPIQIGDGLCCNSRWHNGLALGSS
jgi:DNA end-binding protein Ku